MITELKMISDEYRYLPAHFKYLTDYSRFVLKGGFPFVHSQQGWNGKNGEGQDRNKISTQNSLFGVYDGW